MAAARHSLARSQVLPLVALQPYHCLILFGSGANTVPGGSPPQAETARGEQTNQGQLYQTNPLVFPQVVTPALTGVTRAFRASVPPPATVRSAQLIQIPAHQSSMFIYSTVHGITSSEKQFFVRLAGEKLQAAFGTYFGEHRPSVKCFPTHGRGKN